MDLNITFTDSFNNRVIVAFDEYKFKYPSFLRIKVPLNTDRVIKATQSALAYLTTRAPEVPTTGGVAKAAGHWPVTAPGVN